MVVDYEFSFAISGGGGEGKPHSSLDDQSRSVHFILHLAKLSPNFYETF